MSKNFVKIDFHTLDIPVFDYDGFVVAAEHLNSQLTPGDKTIAWVDKGLEPLIVAKCQVGKQVAGHGNQNIVLDLGLGDIAQWHARFVKDFSRYGAVLSFGLAVDLSFSAAQDAH